MILVTGASGTVGRAVLTEVKQSGAKHRAMYRSQAEAAKAPKGTETVIADFADKQSLGAAMRGVEGLYLVCAPVPELVELESNAIDAAKAAGVKRVVLNSALGAGDYNKLFPSWHRKVEDKLRAIGMANCIIRPNSFHQNVLSYYAPTIRTQGAFYDAMGDSRASYLDVRDIATVVTRALGGGEHDGRIYELNGPEALTCAEVAQKISSHTGVAVRYMDLTIEAQRKALLEAGMPEAMVTPLLDLKLYYRSGKGGELDGTLQRLIGREPITMDKFLAENVDQLRGQAA